MKIHSRFQINHFVAKNSLHIDSKKAVLVITETSQDVILTDLMKYKNMIFIVIASLVIISNINPFNGILKTFVDEKHYRYSNYNGSFTFYEFMSRNFNMMKYSHGICLNQQSHLKDKQIYRLFTKNPLAFWRWRLYFFDERYKLPYKNWKEIEELRRKEHMKKIPGCIIEF